MVDYHLNAKFIYNAFFYLRPQKCPTKSEDKHIVLVMKLHFVIETAKYEFSSRITAMKNLKIKIVFVSLIFFPNLQVPSWWLNRDTKLETCNPSSFKMCGQQVIPADEVINVVQVPPAAESEPQILVACHWK